MSLLCSSEILNDRQKEIPAFADRNFSKLITVFLFFFRRIETTLKEIST
ncbi:MAG: hypothetical protein V7719_09470 [Psychroserpens sp.]